MIMCGLNVVASIVAATWIQTPRTVPKPPQKETIEIYTLKKEDY